MISRISLYVLFLLSTTEAVSQESRSVSALGRLEPENGIIRVSASSVQGALLGGIVAELRVEEGDDVKQGQTLAVTDMAKVLEAQVREGEAGLEFSVREVDTAQSQATEACVRADVAAQEAGRRERLKAQGVAGEEEAESARGEASARQALCESSQTAVRSAEASVAVAKAHLARFQAELERAYVLAPFDGRILAIHARPGELILQDGVMELGRVNRMYAIAEVYETDIRLVRLGQRATISSPALDHELAGSVTRINQKVEKQDEIGTDPAARKDARIIEVEILLENAESVASLTNLQVDVVIHP